MPSSTFGAVDSGNSGLRVMQGTLSDGKLHLVEVARHANAPYQSMDGWRWDAGHLRSALRDGLRAADMLSRLDSIGVDTWGVDCALIDHAGRLHDDPFSYRDERSIPMLAVARDLLPSDELYRLTGCQEMAINTLYQLLADRVSGRLDAANQFLMINDLCTWWLTGQIGADETNASTTGLFDPRTRNWSWEAIDRLQFDRTLFPPVARTGTIFGETSADSGLRPGIPVVNVGGHDTAVAFVGGADIPDALVISLGTWSLVGVEIEAPLINEQSRLANFTNEVGVLGTIRFLRNAAGMWMLQECMREWRETEPDLTWEHIIADAELADPFASLFDPDDPVFMAPGPMESRVRSAGDGHLKSDRGPVVRSIVESLAMNHRWLLERVQSVLDRGVAVIRIVGGGSRNEVLCQFTANATGCEVFAGPFEATAIGNLAMQAIALGHLSGLDEARNVIRESFPQKRFTPQNQDQWEVHYQRWLALISR